MDFESCNERIWRAGLLKKASTYGINRRLWINIKNFIMDRKYYLKVNDYTSQWFMSTVGIPQGSVISPTLCNMYTSDFTEGMVSDHAEYADDNGVWKSDKSLVIANAVVNRDVNIGDKWCLNWNMSIAPEKTEVLVFTASDEVDVSVVQVRLKGELLKVVKAKKILGITVDDKLNFKQHVKEKTQSAFSALRGIESFVQGHKGCSQSVFMKLYRSLVLPIMEYGVAVTVGSVDESSKEFGKVHRAAMIKASGCLNSTSTETLEVLTNSQPIDLQLKLRQAQEVVRIGAKHPEDPLRAEFEAWAENDKIVGRKPSIFHLLMSRFREMKGLVEFDKIEKDFKYTREYMGLIQDIGLLDTEEFENTKEDQEVNIREVLDQCRSRDVLLFTDGSALTNPGPTGAGAVIYLDGYSTSPILLQKGVSPLGNNYTGELVGIQIGLEFLAETDTVNHKNIHILTDCQSAIRTAFGNELPRNKIDIILDSKTNLSKIRERQNEIKVHWVPGHKEIEGNELADQQAKQAAIEMSGSDVKVPPVWDKREAFQEMKNKTVEKWNNRFACAENESFIHEVFAEVGKRRCWGERDIRTFSHLNQLISGHSKLNNHQSKINKEISNLCDMCNIPEDLHHYLFVCKKFDAERIELQKKVEEILHREDANHIGNIDMKVLTGMVEDISREAQHNLVGALMEFIRSSKRF